MWTGGGEKSAGSRGRWALAAVVLLGWGAAIEAAPAPHASLQGTWVINTYLTSQLTKDQGGQRSDSGNGGGFGRHSGGGGRGGRNRQTPAPDAPGDAAAAENGNPLDTLTITQSDQQVTVTDKEGHDRLLKTDGTAIRDENAHGGPAQIKASWDSDGSLVVETKPDKGSTRTETYEVANDHKHLYVTVSGGSHKMVRAYDPAPVEEAAPAPAPTPPPPGAS
jgi:hypothetical protein